VRHQASIFKWAAVAAKPQGVGNAKTPASVGAPTGAKGAKDFRASVALIFRSNAPQESNEDRSGKRAQQRAKLGESPVMLGAGDLPTGL